MSTELKLGVLDQSPVPAGDTAGTALEHSADLAQHAEALGFSRFWMSEHHAMPLLASSAPEVVLACIGAVTRSIRLGSGGIMLPHYSPFKVAEVFRTLHALYPGRIDLGVGRAPGGGPIESQALGRDRNADRLRNASDDFPEQVAELLGWLGQRDSFPKTHPFRRVHVAPEVPGGPTVWVLGSSLWGAAAAAQWGLPYAFAHFFSPVATRQALETYHRSFHPSAQLAAPQAMIAVGVIVAPTDEEALFLHSSVRLLQQRIRQGDRSPVARPEEALSILRREEEAQDEFSLGGFRQGAALQSAEEQGEYSRYIVGSPQTVHSKLQAMTASLGLNEVLVNTIVHSHEARLRSYRLLATAFDLAPALPISGAEPSVSEHSDLPTAVVAGAGAV